MWHGHGLYGWYQRCCVRQEGSEWYIHPDRKEFPIPLRSVGTPFQRSVLQALLNVHYGHVLSCPYHVGWIHQITDNGEVMSGHAFFSARVDGASLLEAAGPTA